MRLGLLGTPSGTLAQRTARIGVQKLEKTPSGILGKISDRSKDKFRGSISGMYRPEDNVTRKKYGKDYRNFIWSVAFSSIQSSLSNYPLCADLGYNGKTIINGVGILSGPFYNSYSSFKIKQLYQNGSMSGGSDYSDRNILWRVWYTIFDYILFYPQVSSVAWSRDGRHLLVLGELVRYQFSNASTYITRGGSIMMVWDTSSAWSYTTLTGHPNQSPYIDAVGVEPWYHFCNTWSEGSLPLYGEDCCWNDDGTKIYRYNRTTSSTPGTYENVIIQSNLNTAYNIGYSNSFPGTLNAATLSVGQIYSFWFSDDGYYVYTYARDGYIYQYKLSTAWSISTVSTITSVDISGLSIPNTSKRYARNFKDHILALAFIASPSTYKTTFYETRQSWY